MFRRPFLIHGNSIHFCPEKIHVIASEAKRRNGEAILYFTGFHILLKIKNLRIKSDTLNPAHFQNPKGFKFKRRLSERINAV
jgi:hypothetical protein